MLSSFWSGLGGELAKQWSARVLTPAFTFWTAGAALVWWHLHAAGIRSHGWSHELQATGQVLGGLPAAEQILLVVGGLLILTGSAFLAERLTLPLLRLMEGYWTRPRWLRGRLVAYRRWRYRRHESRRASLALRQRFGGLGPAEFRRLQELQADPPVNADPALLQQLRDRQKTGFDARMSADLGRARRILHQMPRSDALGMPTRLGDILRTAELRPGEKYGLDAVICWYALWSVLPAETQRGIVEARLALDGAARAWLWGVLFAVWAPWNWWAPVVAAGVAALTYYSGITGGASLFGELTSAAYDLHRFRLYAALRVPDPTSPGQERRETGPQVTNLLWGGLDTPGFSYAPAPAEGKGS